MLNANKFQVLYGLFPIGSLNLKLLYIYLPIYLAYFELFKTCVIPTALPAIYCYPQKPLNLFKSKDREQICRILNITLQ